MSAVARKRHELLLSAIVDADRVLDEYLARLSPETVSDLARFGSRAEPRAATKGHPHRPRSLQALLVRTVSAGPS